MKFDHLQSFSRQLSLDNYFIFPDLDQPFYPIQEAMKRYQALTEHRERYGGKIEPRWFPISEFEDWMQVIVGSEEQQETSPVLYFTTDDPTKSLYLNCVGHENPFKCESLLAQQSV